MGTYNKGILGPFSGKVGTVVGANWRGKDIMRSLPKKTDRKATETQELQRKKFTMVNRFLTPLKPVINLYYGQPADGLSRANLASSYHLNEALTVNGDMPEIVYSKVQIAKGDLTGLQSYLLTSDANGSIKLDWSNNSGQGQAKATDKLVVVVYEPSTKLSSLFLDAGTRQQGTATLIQPPFFSGKEVEVWATFASQDDKRFATSSYLGQVTVS